MQIRPILFDIDIDKAKPRKKSNFTKVLFISLIIVFLYLFYN